MLTWESRDDPNTLRRKPERCSASRCCAVGETDVPVRFGGVITVVRLCARHAAPYHAGPVAAPA